jgi:hypothetical protein
MNKSINSKKNNTNLGGGAFFKNRDLFNRYRRKPLNLCGNARANDLYYLLILIK